MNEFEDITGVVLAGGRARRMGGEDKGLLNINERYLIEYVIARLEKQVTSVLINANRSVEIYESLDYPVVRDTVGDFAGPLAGIHAGMCAATTGWVLTVPCDCPFFPRDLVFCLWQAVVESRAELAVACADERDQPVFMLARSELADDIADFLQSGDGKIDRWYARLHTARVEFDNAAAFANINTPEELEAARLRLSGAE